MLIPFEGEQTDEDMALLSRNFHCFGGSVHVYILQKLGMKVNNSIYGSCIRVPEIEAIWMGLFPQVFQINQQRPASYCQLIF